MNEFEIIKGDVVDQIFAWCSDVSAEVPVMMPDLGGIRIAECWAFREHQYFCAYNNICVEFGYNDYHSKRAMRSANINVLIGNAGSHFVFPSSDARAHLSLELATSDRHSEIIVAGDELESVLIEPLTYIRNKIRKARETYANRVYHYKTELNRTEEENRQHKIRLAKEAITNP